MECDSHYWSFHVSSACKIHIDISKYTLWMMATPAHLRRRRKACCFLHRYKQTATIFLKCSWFQGFNIIIMLLIWIFKIGWVTDLTDKEKCFLISELKIETMVSSYKRTGKNLAVALEQLQCTPDGFLLLVSVLYQTRS